MSAPIATQPGAKFQKALTELERAEKDLRRAFNRWEKRRAKVLRMEKRIAQAECST